MHPPQKLEPLGKQSYPPQGSDKTPVAPQPHVTPRGDTVVLLEKSLRNAFSPFLLIYCPIQTTLKGPPLLLASWGVFWNELSCYYFLLSLKSK